VCLVTSGRGRSIWRTSPQLPTGRPSSLILTGNQRQDAAFDMAAVVREVEGLPTGDPLTTWHDHEPLEQALDFFVRFRGDNTNLDVDEDHPAWQRLVLVVGDAAWFEQAEAYLHALSTRADA